MSAIAGMIGISFEEETINKILTTMQRRGPDDHDVFQDENCCLIHTRLALSDSEEKEPMTRTYAGETYTILCDGELYNASEIRTELLKLGERFTGTSDAEVILCSYAYWGESCLQKLNGNFAFAVWRKSERSVFLARDRMGVKPLFYCLQHSGIVFASEMKTIFASGVIYPTLDAEGITQLFLLGPGRVPGSGVFRDVFELEPGCCGEFKNGHFYKKVYWKLQDHLHTDSFEDTADKVRWLVTDAVQRQCSAQVPIGCFLSGGLDSSIITAICAKEYAQKGSAVQTFSVDYANNDRYFVPNKFQPDSDNAYIDVMRTFTKAEHTAVTLTAQQLSDHLQTAMQARDLPGMADVDASLLVFCGEIRKNVKVALSGECADEIFGGYPWFRDPEIRALAGFPWSQNIQHRSGFLHPEFRAQIDPNAYVMDHYRSTIDQCDVLPGTSRLERRMKEMTVLNMRWFMQTLTDRKDRMSMHNGLAARVPFCDYRIVEYMYAVPWEFKDYRGREKGLLRYAMRGILPETIVQRKKSPYPKTFDPGYLEVVSRRLREILVSKDSPILQIANKRALQQLLDAEFSWPWYGQLMRLPQTIAYMLQIDAWLRTYNITLI